MASIALVQHTSKRHFIRYILGIKHLNNLSNQNHNQNSMLQESNLLQLSYISQTFAQQMSRHLTDSRAKHSLRFKTNNPVIMDELSHVQIIAL